MVRPKTQGNTTPWWGNQCDAVIKKPIWGAGEMDPLVKALAAKPGPRSILSLSFSPSSPTPLSLSHRSGTFESCRRLDLTSVT